MKEGVDRSAMRFGIFLALFHDTGENPTLALNRDLELMEHLDRLGFDEVWIGEHHSGGLEIIASPEVFIAAAAERTKFIKFGTGVASLPYHHPLVLAGRMIQLDHQTRGRTMFGVGGDAAELRADRALRDPALPPRQQAAHRRARMGRLQPRRIHRPPHRSGADEMAKWRSEKGTAG